jgi:hypothetical protein
MNERIRQLAEQAGILIDWGEDIKVGRWGIGGKYENMQKFAHLLMREIATVQITHQASMDLENKKMDDPAKELNYAVIEHFGVEE